MPEALIRIQFVAPLETVETMMRIWIAILLLASAAVAFAQLPSQGKPDPVTSPTGKPFDTMFFYTKIGSFRLVGTQELEGNKRVRAEGRVTIRFSGTALINDLKGNITVSGNLRKEYDAQGRLGYFGTGTLVVDGAFWAIQVFGKDIDGRWTGWGLARMYGEFDDKLNTGMYWTASAPKKLYWSPHGTTHALQGSKLPTNVVPKERKGGGG